MDRFEKQRLVFGEEGQKRLRATTVAIAGGGGIGAFVALELAYLGLGKVAIVDADIVERSNRNRLVGAWELHPDGTPKVDVLRDLIALIDSTIEVETVQATLESTEGRAALTEADVVMGCVDRDGARLALNEFCCERGLSLIDSASDTLPKSGKVLYGGRVCVAVEETGCLMCFGVLDQDEIREDLASPEQQADRDSLYGVARTALGGGGPSIVSVNGVVASLAVTELMVLVTGIRAPMAHQDWHGHAGLLRRVIDREPGCYYCRLRPGRQAAR